MKVKKILIYYMIFHILLVLVITATAPIFWPVFFLPFLIYGGIQAVLLLHCCIECDSSKVSVFRLTSIYVFSLVELLYTTSLLLADLYGRFDISLPVLRGSFFNHSELFIIYYSLVPNGLFFILWLFWFALFELRRFRRCKTNH